MRSKILFFILILVSFLLLPIGVKSGPKDKGLLRQKSLKSLKPDNIGGQLKGNSVDSDDLYRGLV